MKKSILLSLLFTCGFIAITVAQSTKDRSVEKAVQQLSKAMIDGDSASLDQLTMNELTYGHSSGHIDSKTVFIEKIVSGKSDFVSIDLTDQTIIVSKKTAIVRHRLNAVTNDNGKPGEVKLFVLLVWQELPGGWKLLARQAVKQPENK